MGEKERENMTRKRKCRSRDNAIQPTVRSEGLGKLSKTLWDALLVRDEGKGREGGMKNSRLLVKNVDGDRQITFREKEGR